MADFFQPYIYELIKEEIKRVQDAHIAPAVATKQAIMAVVYKDIDEAIESLVADGLITKSMNINHIPLYKLAER